MAAAIELLEREAYDRAMAGSDQLIMFCLRRLRPEVYCERYKARHVARPAALREEVDRDRELYNDPEVTKHANAMLRALNAARQRRDGLPKHLPRLAA